jgi:hypothetical protein
MKSSNRGTPNRREFLIGSLSPVIAASCLGVVGSGELIAESQKVRKASLTPEAFTARMASSGELVEIRRDLVGYVNAHFDLSPGQLENFRKVPREDIRNLSEALEKAEKQKLRVTLRTRMSPLSCGDGQGFRMKTSFDSSGLTILSYR